MRNFDITSGELFVLNDDNTALILPYNPETMKKWTSIEEAHRFIDSNDVFYVTLSDADLAKHKKHHELISAHTDAISKPFAVGKSKVALDDDIIRHMKIEVKDSGRKFVFIKDVDGNDVKITVKQAESLILDYETFVNTANSNLKEKRKLVETVELVDEIQF